MTADGRRVTFLDFDARREPKTEFWCVKCQRDLDPARPYRLVRYLDWALVVHPDEPERDGDEVLPIGMDCARKLGMAWTSTPKLGAP